MNRVSPASNACTVVPDMGREQHHFKDSPSCVFAFKSTFSEGKECDLLRLLQAIPGIRCSLLASFRGSNERFGRTSKHDLVSDSSSRSTYFESGCFFQ